MFGCGTIEDTRDWTVNQDTCDEALMSRATWCNLLLPGSGLILCQELWSGLLVGLVFAFSANFAVAAIWLFPDDFGGGWRELLVGMAGGSYAGAQLRLRHEIRVRRAAGVAERRRQALAQAQERLAAGDAAGALACLEVLAPLAEKDLLVAYRLAQALTAAGRVAEARAAWRLVRRLDRHGLYRRQAEENERRLAAPDE